MSYFKCGAFVIFVTLLCSCHYEHEQNDGSHEHSEEGKNTEKNKNKIDIPSNVRANLGISFVKVEKRQLNNVLRIPGHFELLPEAYRNYHTNLPGSVELKVNLLDKVKVGQLLYELNSPAWLELKKELIKVTSETRNLQAALKLSNSNKNRYKQSSTHQVEQLLLEEASLYTGLSIKELQQKVIINDREVPRWFSIKKLEIRALSDGIVKQSNVTNGEWVDLGSRVLSVVNLMKLGFKANALQTDIPHVQFGELAFISQSEVTSGNNKRVSARIMSDALANDAQRTFQVYASSDELPLWAKPGVGGYLEIILDKNSRPKLAIPKAVIVRDGLVDVFFRRDPKNPNKAIRVEADLGVDDGKWVEVKSGVRKNDEVILNGVYELNIAHSSSKSESKKGGHFHADGTWHDEAH